MGRPKVPQHRRRVIRFARMEDVFKELLEEIKDEQSREIIEIKLHREIKNASK